MLLALVLSLFVQEPPPPAQRIARDTMLTQTPVEVIARDMISRIDAPKQVVVRTPAEWAALWKEHAGESPAPKVDLAGRTVVAVFLGTRSSAGYSVDITGTRESKGVLTVLWSERRPDPGDITAQMITSPMVAAAIQKFAGEIKFEKVGK